MKLKKFLAVVSALCMICAVVPFSEKYVPKTIISASAEDAEYTEGTYKNLKYKKYADYVEISGVKDDSITKAIISAEIDGLPVTSIGKDAFYNCSSLTFVTLPDSVISIGDYAFSGCSSLTSVTIPNSVTSIGNFAFSSCSGLTSITIPNGVTSIGNNAFWYCYNLTSIEVSENNTAYTSENGVLFDKEKTTLTAYPIRNTQTEYMIPDSVTSIGNNAFLGCSNLTSVKIPSSVTSIGEYAFSACLGLTSVTISNSVTSIGFCAFYYCSGLTSVTIPDSVTSIGYNAFNDCKSLTSVTIENPDCEIPYFNTTINNGHDENDNFYFNGTIYGYENSTAQTYAEKYGYTFEVLGSAPEVTEPTETETSAPVAPAEDMVWNGVNPDITRDGQLDASDAAILLTYAAEFGAGKVSSFKEFMDKYYS